jgi:hypothetical protein
MASGNDEVYETLKNIMFMDSAVAGEAAGLAMGLVMLGSASKKGKENLFSENSWKYFFLVGCIEKYFSVDFFLLIYF